MELIIGANNDIIYIFGWTVLLSRYLDCCSLKTPFPKGLVKLRQNVHRYYLRWCHDLIVGNITSLRQSQWGKTQNMQNHEPKTIEPIIEPRGSPVALNVQQRAIKPLISDGKWWSSKKKIKKKNTKTFHIYQIIFKFF